jgi:hypothetical protein
MARLREQLANIMEYFGVRSSNYYHSARERSEDLDDPLVYYLDQRRRAEYDGPFDERGVPIYVQGDIRGHLPVHACFYALGHLELLRKTDHQEHRRAFLAVAHWLLRTQTEHGTWLSPFPMPRFNLGANHPSAMSQGLGISVLVRAHRLTGGEEYLRAALAALPVFDEAVTDGGVACHDGDLVFYEEYPSEPCSHVLNGFIYALWGLYDLARLDDNAAAWRLWETGVRTLVTALPRYDTGYWSLYHLSGGRTNPAAVHYHRLHVAQLDIMHQLTGDETFRIYRDKWQRYLNRPMCALRTLPAKIRWRLHSHR